MNTSPVPTTLRLKILPLLNLAGLAMVLTANTMAIVLPLNGKTTNQLSDQYPNLFVPAGITFSIWSVIYLLLILFTIYQFTAYSSSGKQKGAVNVVNKMGLLFLISCLANSLWIFSWHYEKVLLSVFIMLSLLISLIAINGRFGIYASGQGWRHNLFVQVPFSIYLAWISIATIANISALLTFYNWDGWGITETVWTNIMIITAAAITLLMILRRNNIYFSLVVLWAYYGIILKRQEVNVGGSIVTTCLVVMVVICITNVIIIAQLNRKVSKIKRG